MDIALSCEGWRFLLLKWRGRETEGVSALDLVGSGGEVKRNAGWEATDEEKMGVDCGNLLIYILSGLYSGCGGLYMVRHRTVKSCQYRTAGRLLMRSRRQS